MAVYYQRMPAHQTYLFCANTTFCTEIIKLSDKDVFVHVPFGNKIPKLLYHVMDPGMHKTSILRGHVSYFLRSLQKCY